VIDLYANLIGFNYIDAANGSAQAVMECTQAGVDNGIEMVIIADGDSRHVIHQNARRHQGLLDERRIK